MSLGKKCFAEAIGTFWLVLGGCGSAVLAAAYTEFNVNPQAAAETTAKATVNLGIGTIGVSLAFGLTVLTMAYAIGHISGCHLNPAVSFGLWAANRFPSSHLLPYIGAQVAGAFAAAGTIWLIASGNGRYSFTGSNPLATNGFGDHSPQGYSLLSCFLIEAILTFVFLIVILGSTDGRAPQGFAPIAIGLCLTLIHLISIPVTNTSVNPARSLGPALWVGFAGNGVGLSQVWLFWLAPIVGAVVAGWLYKNVFDATAAYD